MKRIDKKMIETAQIIDNKFSKCTDDNREEISTDILPHIRHLCEAIMYKIYDEEKNEDLFQTLDNLRKVKDFCRSKYHDIYDFHTLLDKSVGHIDYGKLQSEALTIKYIPKLILLKDFVSKNYGIDLLKNIDKYPLDLDDSLISFYEKILVVLLSSIEEKGILTRNQYFVRKRSLKYINNQVFYEYVFDVSDDKTNKFNTFVCYSLRYIKFDYDMRMILLKKEITFLDTNININIIIDYEYSIRPCTFKNLLNLIGISTENFKRDKEYHQLMVNIKLNHVSLVDIVDEKFNIQLNPSNSYFKFFKYLKEFACCNKLGRNVIRYLLLEMRNNIIRAQTYKPRYNQSLVNEKFDNLKICLGAKSFEVMPFAFNPKQARPSIYTLIELFDVSERKDEVLYRHMVEFINQNNTLFLKPEDIGYSKEKFNELKVSFNNKILKVNPYYNDHKIIEVYGYFTIKSYFDMTVDLIKHSRNLCLGKNINTHNDYSSNKVLTDSQRQILEKLFSNSSIELVTGSAGTGKTTLIKEFIKNNSDKKILCLTTTNTANNNLKIKDYHLKIKYMNISQFEIEKQHDDFDIIIVDEASFVSTYSMHTILTSYLSSLFLIVGDPNQIESIEFGNWFSLLLSMLKQDEVVHILETELRTSVKEISNIWNTVKEGKKKGILELLSAYDMTEKLNYEIFSLNEEEVVLCLNYDGLYGINNINRYLQSSNKNLTYEYQQNYYKINDPVVFIINDYNNYGIYNNFRGKIVDIIDGGENIKFKIELLDEVKIFGRISQEMEIYRETDKSYALIKKIKYYNDKYDSDMDTRTKLPFQISYAMSIHKAQGLEFDSVKIVITKEADEMIDKNIFYTAVTRAKKNLKIYWEPEVANYVLNNIEQETTSRKVDLEILNQWLK